MDLPTSISIVGGSLSITGLVIAFVQWSLKRNVDHEDTSKARMESRIDAQEKNIVELRTQHVELRGEVRNVVSLISEVRGVLVEMRQSQDAGREKMASFYRDELGKLEEKFREDIRAARRESTLPPRRKK